MIPDFRPNENLRDHLVECLIATGQCNDLDTLAMAMTAAEFGVMLFQIFPDHAQELISNFDEIKPNHTRSIAREMVIAFIEEAQMKGIIA